MTYEQLVEIVTEVITETDFEKIHKVMTFLDWKWMTFPPRGKDAMYGEIFTSGGEIPDIERLQSDARKRCFAAIDQAMRPQNSGHWMISGSGGLHAQAWYDENTDKLFLRLSFQITDYQYEPS